MENTKLIPFGVKNSSTKAKLKLYGEKRNTFRPAILRISGAKASPELPSVMTYVLFSA